MPSRCDLWRYSNWDTTALTRINDSVTIGPNCSTTVQQWKLDLCLRCVWVGIGLLLLRLCMLCNDFSAGDDKLIFRPCFDGDAEVILDHLGDDTQRKINEDGESSNCLHDGGKRCTYRLPQQRGCGNCSGRARRSR